MQRLYQVPDDFEATIRILPVVEGGRASPTFNGIRWDLAYADSNQPDQVYMIWPDFYNASGDSIPSDQALPVGIPLQARMTVVDDTMRADVHRARIAPGVEFFCQEGAIRVATGRVTRITGLHTPRGSWVILTCPERGDITSPTRGDLERTARFLLQPPATKEIADYLEEHGAAYLRYGFDDGPMHVIGVTCGGSATFETWADQDYMTQLGEPSTLPVTEESAVRLWELLASGDIDRVTAAFSAGSLEGSC
jgi:hypothetical protein